MVTRQLQVKRGTEKVRHCADFDVTWTFGSARSRPTLKSSTKSSHRTLHRGYHTVPLVAVLSYDIVVTSSSLTTLVSSYYCRRPGCMKLWGGKGRLVPLVGGLLRPTSVVDNVLPFTVRSTRGWLYVTPSSNQR